MSKLLLNADGKVLTSNDKVLKAPKVEDNLDKLLNNTLTEYSNSEITSIKEYLFSSGYSKLISASFPNVTQIRDYAFANCSKLTNINIPLVNSLLGYVFKECTSLISIDLPKLESMGGSVFYGCSKLANVNMPLLIALGAWGFHNCTSLTNVKLPKVRQIYLRAFYSCKNLTDVYLGYDGLVSLANVNVFENITSGCKVHVRSEYAEQYATATNWVSLINDGTVVIVGDYTD